MKLVDLDEPRPARPGWVMAKTRMTGICGSEAKQVFMDFGEANTDSPLANLFTFPTILGHEVVADVADVGPGVPGLEVGQRVVLNPWLSCAPRGIDPVCPSCEAGDFSLCWHFTEGPLAAGIHTGTCKDAPGGFADYFPAHHTMLFPVPDDVPDELAVFADPFAVSLHSVTRHPPPPGGRALVYGAGALGTTATAILRALYPDVEVMVVARFPTQAALARRLGATVVDPEPRQALIEQAAAWSGGVLQPVRDGLPMAHPGGIDVVYDTIGKPETFEVGVRAPQGARHPGEERGARPGALGVLAALLQGDHLGGIERLRRRGGRRACASTASPTSWTWPRRVGSTSTGMLTHTFRLEQWREAFTVLAEQERSGAIKVAFDFR